MLLNSQTFWAFAVLLALSTHAAGIAGNREGPTATFEVVQVDTAQAKVKGLLRIRNPMRDTLFLFPLQEAFPLGQIDVMLHRRAKSEVFRAYGALDAACYVPDTVLPGGELVQPLTLGHGRWRTDVTNLPPGGKVSRILNPLRGGVKAIGLKYHLRYSIDVLKLSGFDGFTGKDQDCPYNYYLEPIVAPPVQVNLP